MPACADWALCSRLIDGGAGCEAGVLAVSAPTEGSTYSVRELVPVSATLTLASGGAWPVSISIPVSTSWGARAVIDGGVDGGLIGSADAGMYRVTFGWDAGPQNVERSVSFTSCESARCQAWQECVPTVSGGQCENLSLTVSVTTPASDGTATRSTMQQFVVRVVSADGGRLPTEVPVVGPGQNAAVQKDMASPNTYTTMLTLGAPDAVKTYVVGWPDSGVPTLSVTRSLTYDGTAPGVVVEVQTPPVRQSFEQDPAAIDAWKKDEAALVAVRVTDTTSPIEPVTTTMVMAPGGGLVTAAPGQCSMCTAPAMNALTGCFCFRADLSRTPMLAARVTATVTVTGVLDRLMNASAAVQSAPFTVTRFKWARTFNGAAAGVQPLAVGDGGVVFAATREPSSGRVMALAPSGAVLWETSDAGIITAGPAVGAAVWVGTQLGIETALTPLSPTTGLAGVRACFDNVTGAAFEGDLVVAPLRRLGVTAEGALGVRAGIDEVFAGAPSCGSVSGLVATTGTPLLAARPTAGNAIEVFANRGGTSPLTKQSFDNVWAGNGSVTFQVGIGSLVSLLTGPTFVGGGGGGGVPASGFVTLFGNGVGSGISGATVLRVPANGPPTNEEPYSPVSMSVSHLYAGNASGALRRFAVSSGALTGTTDGATGLGDISKTTPVLGKGGFTYVVSTGGAVSEVAWAGSSGAGTARWTFAGLFPAPSSLGQPALDVVRDGAGAAQCGRGIGVFYVPSVRFGVATVTAVIVDSPGLDPLAPWPKYQRDNRNSGFADSTSPGVCP
jgi:hypothetical protein